ncbi:MAG: hypothetical protein ABH867_03235 [Patescibacteria group bacterium]|nr:hypothetical protein [Patescibacteria group bacterium]
MRLKFCLLILIFPFLFTFSFFYRVRPSSAQAECKIPDNFNSLSPDQKSTLLSEIINSCDQLSREAQSKIKSLSSQINYMNSQIQLAILKIDQTANQIEILEIQIGDLSKKISVLNVSLNETAALFINRVIATYKAGKTSALDLIFSSSSFGDFFRITRYLKAAQTHDRQMMIAMEEIRLNYDQQKKEKEERQKDLEELKVKLAQQKADLDKQQANKKHLLAVTRNDEKQYQELLSQARAEYQAIQAILAGKGDEIEVGGVSQGEVIASIISGPSCNSSGTHLHFTIADNAGNVSNPFSYLKQVDYRNCSGPSPCSAADPFNPGGGWDWPVSPPVILAQGYGVTWAVNNTWVGRIYNFHNGIDIAGSSNQVKAVQEGTLYRGSYTGSGGCRLRYVRVKHKDSNLSAYYLHINYEKV